MDNVIYTYGGGEILWYVFNAIAAILGGSAKNSTLMQIFHLAAVIGGFWAIVSIAVKNNPVFGIKWFAWFLIATEVLFIPKVPVMIKDPVNQYYRHVPNVPFGLAFIAGTLNRFGHIMTEKMEQNFSLPDDFKYHQTGSVFASRLLRSMDKVRITDADFAQSMHNFVNQCIVLPAMIGNKYTIEELRDSKDMWGLVKANAPKLLRFSYIDPKNRHAPPKLLSCREGAAKLEEDLKDAVSKVTGKYANINIPDFISSQLANSDSKKNRESVNAQAKSLIESNLTSLFSTLKAESNNAENVLKQQMMINAVIDGSGNKLIGMGGATNYATAKAMLQQKNTHVISGALAQGLPVFKTVLEAIVYGAFVFIIMLALLPNGQTILFRYFQTIAWLQLWAPLNAIINLIMTVSAKNHTIGKMGEKSGLTLANSAGIVQLNEDIYAYAAWISLSVPFIAIAIVTGVSSFVHLASQISGGAQGAAASAAGEITSGNLSLGNVSHRMRSMESMQAFQNNMSPSFERGHHKEKLADGTLKTTTLDGKQIYTAGAGHTHSVLGTKIHAIESLTGSFNEDIRNEKSAIDSRNKELSNLEQNTLRQTADFIERATIAKNSGTSYDVGDSTTSGKTLQNAVDLTNSLQKRFGMTTKQAAHLAGTISGDLSLGIGGKGSPVGIKIAAALKGQYSTDAQREQTAAEVADFVKKSGYNENLDSITKATKDIRYGESQSEDKALSESLNASHDKIQSLRESNSMSEQNIAKYGEALSRVHSDVLSINQDVGQQFLEYLSTRQMHGHEIGMNTARKMFNNWDSNAQMYSQYFVRDVLKPRVLNEVSDAMNKGRAAVDTTFDNTSVGTIDNQKELFESVHERAEVYNVTRNVVQNEDLKARVENKLDEANVKIEERRVENTEKTEEMQKKADEQYKKNLVTAAASKIGSTKKENV